MRWTVFRFVEPPDSNEKHLDSKKVKFKIMSLKVKGGTDYVPELVTSHCLNCALGCIQNGGANNLLLSELYHTV